MSKENVGRIHTRTTGKAAAAPVAPGRAVKASQMKLCSSPQSSFSEVVMVTGPSGGTDVIEMAETQEMTWEAATIRVSSIVMEAMLQGGVTASSERPHKQYITGEKPKVAENKRATQ